MIKKLKINHELSKIMDEDFGEVTKVKDHVYKLSTRMSEKLAAMFNTQCRDLIAIFTEYEATTTDSDELELFVVDDVNTGHERKVSVHNKLVEMSLRAYFRAKIKQMQ